MRDASVRLALNDVKQGKVPWQTKDHLLRSAAWS